MIAAATTSLPETPGGERNWDYRYSWIRDSTFMLWGLYMLGFEWEANDYFYFIADVAEAEEGDLQIMYGIDGESRLDEQILDHLTGYDGAPAGADRERRLQPAPERRLGRRARLDLPARQVARPPPRAHVADPEAPGGGRAHTLARARPRHLGGARRAAALHLLEADVLGRGRPRARLARLRDDSASAERWRPRRPRSTQTSARTRSTSGASSPSTTTPRPSTPRCS